MCVAFAIASWSRPGQTCLRLAWSRRTVVSHLSVQGPSAVCCLEVAIVEILPVRLQIEFDRFGH
jgi:hypothetical protein